MHWKIQYVLLRVIGACTYIPSIAKFVDAIFQPIETQFAGYVAAIGEQTKRMNDLAQAAQAALTRDTKDKVDNTGFGEVENWFCIKKKIC